MASGVIHSTPMIQSGKTAVITVPASSYKDLSVTFDETFNNIPDIVVGFYTYSTAHAFGRCSCSVSAESTTGFTVRVFNNDTSQRQPEIRWIAVGT